MPRLEGAPLARACSSCSAKQK